MKRHLLAILAALILLAFPATASATPQPIENPKLGHVCGDTYNGFEVWSKRATCPFARDVGNHFMRNHAKYGTYRVYSAAVKRTITMRCRVIGNGYGGKYGLCTGGNNARVSVVS